MVNYKKLGYNSKNEYAVAFSESLLLSNHTYDFFVDWEKVYSNLEDYVVEIGILNSLNNVSSEKTESKFGEIIVKYPEVVPLLPTILAIRSKKEPIFDFNDYSSKVVNFSKNSFDIDEIMDFSIHTGLLDLFNNIDDLYSYLVGTEVGLDTNARKNRSGHIFEDIVGRFLEEKIKDYSQYSLVKEDVNVVISRNKRFDYVIYEKDVPKFAFECNFYNSTGSKPIEVAHSYAELQKDLDDANIVFIWITDGPGWNRMFTTLMNVADDIEFIVTFNMLNEILDSFL